MNRIVNDRTIHLSPVTIHTAASITPNRRVVLGFDHSSKAKILKSTVKFAVKED